MNQTVLEIIACAGLVFSIISFVRAAMADSEIVSLRRQVEELQRTMKLTVNNTQSLAESMLKMARGR